MKNLHVSENWKQNQPDHRTYFTAKARIEGSGSLKSSVNLCQEMKQGFELE